MLNLYSKQAIIPEGLFRSLWKGMTMAGLMLISSFFFVQNAQAVVVSDCSTSNCIYSDLTYAPGVSGWLVNGVQTIAAPFTPSGNFTLSSITVGVSGLNGPATVNVSLLADNGSGLPGAIKGVPVSLPITSVTFSNMTVDFSSQNIPLLTGTQYWVELKYASGSDGVWQSLQSDTGVFAADLGSGYFLFDSFFPMFAVYGTPVPEPSMIGLFGGMMLSMAWIAHRKLRKE